MESERMLHPVINQEGVDTQNEVVKEEKRLRVDNQPYGKFWKMSKSIYLPNTHTDGQLLEKWPIWTQLL
jgi:predicted Zn-dependent peptidase